MEIDATFWTNRLRMPVLICTGISNTNKTFPLAFTYILSDSVEAFDWLFKSLDLFVFNDDWLHPRIVLSDQATGLVASWTRRQRHDKTAANTTAIATATAIKETETETETRTEDTRTAQKTRKRIA